MGGGADDYFQSGWVGLLPEPGLYATGLSTKIYPNPEMLDPPEVKMGNAPLIFHQRKYQHPFRFG